jgi:hypothetical protein
MSNKHTPVIAVSSLTLEPRPPGKSGYPFHSHRCNFSGSLD